MVYERKGINVIFEDSRQDGLILKDFLEQRFDPDGGRFDYGQEEHTKDLHAITYMGRWTAEIQSEFVLKITSPPDPELGIVSTRVFKLDPGSSRLSITQSMRNISTKTTNYFFWGRTLVKPEGKLFMPVNPKSLYPDKWGRYIWGDPEIFISDPEDPAVEITDNIFSLIPSKAQNEKYGTDSHDGWMAYGYKSLLFIKKYNYFPDSEYTEKYGLTNIFYTNKLFAEMEPVSPAASLKPGEEYSYEENWFLLEYEPCHNISFEVKKAIEFLNREISEK